MRKLLCRVGAHSRLIQYDSWGAARVCRYCDWNAPESCDRHTHTVAAPYTRGNTLGVYLRKADARKQGGDK